MSGALKHWAGPLAVLVGLSTGSAASTGAPELVLASGPGQVAGLSWEALELHYRTRRNDEPRWALRIEGLETAEGTALGTLAVTCRSDEPTPSVGCQDARLEWLNGDDRLELALGFTLGAVDGARELAIRAEGWSLDATGPGPERDDWRVHLRLGDVGLAGLGTLLAELSGLTLVDARLSGELTLDDGQLTADLTVSGLDFDTTDGRVAGAGVALALTLDLDLSAPQFPFRLRMRQDSGEILAGAVYLPPPKQPLSLAVAGRRPTADEWVIEHLELNDPDALEITGRARLRSTASGWAVGDLTLETISVELPLAWERWFDGWAGAAGFAGLDTRGRVTARGRLGSDGSPRLSARLDSVSIRDPMDRFALENLAGEVSWGADGPAADLGWQGIALYDLPLRQARLRLASDARGPRLVEPLRLPLIDGALVLDQLRWSPDSAAPAFVELDARIEPISLAPLTRQLGFPEFGGRLSGEFPGVRLAGDRIQFTGGIDIQAFSGAITIADLVIERPFGTLPALAADVTLSRLDLLQLTGAFNFGRMEGQVSGWMRGLRLLDWMPVAMDTRLFTHEDVPQRRISQRAVDNLSSLGGAGGALMTGTVLSMFEEFPYRRAGLACRLTNNICHVDGVARHESGGFYILEGRGLPRLDIIGHRRLVDWPLLLRQLESIAQ